MAMNASFTGGGAFHRNMMRLEAKTFDPANTGHIIVNSEMVRREIIQEYEKSSADESTIDDLDMG